MRHDSMRRAFGRPVRVRRAPLVAVIPLLIAVGLQAQDRNEPPFYAIRDARIVTGSGDVLDRGTIVLEDGLITAVGPNAAIPPEARIIEGAGKTVYPGLVDALGNLGLPRAGNAGGARRRQGTDEGEPPPYSTGPEDRPGTFTWKVSADALNSEDARIERWRSSGFTSALTVFQDGIFPGQAAFINLAGEKGERMVLTTPAAVLIQLEEPGGYRGYPGSLMGVIAYVKQVFADVDHYQQAWTAYERGPRGRKRPDYDRALAPLAESQSNGIPLLLPAVWAKEIDRVVRIGRSLSAKTIVYGAHQGYDAVEILRSRSVPVLVSAKWPSRAKDANPDAEEPLRVLQLRERAPETPRALHEAGIRFAFYSDGLETPDEFLTNVRRAVDAGLPSDAAVRALSLSAAEIFGLDDRLGSLEPGKIANLFVADGELFADDTKVEMVFVDGARYSVPEKEGRSSGDRRGSPPGAAEDDPEGGNR